MRLKLTGLQKVYFNIPIENPKEEGPYTREKKVEKHPASFTLSDTAKGVTAVLKWYTQVYPWDEVVEESFEVVVKRPFTLSGHVDVEEMEWVNLVAYGPNDTLKMSCVKESSWRKLHVWAKSDTYKHRQSSRGEVRTLILELDEVSAAAMRRFHESLTVKQEKMTL